MMNAIHPLHVLLALLFMLCIQTSSQSFSKDGNVIMCIERERDALLLFRQGFANEYDDKLDSWNKEEEDCCKWKGVGCNNRTGHVTHLLLSYLSESDYSHTNIVNIISNSLLDLPYLSYLDLSKNIIRKIPEFIGSLTNLIHLDLSQTFVGGTIPSQIGNLSNLQYLNLNTNYFDFPFPKFIGSLNNLRYLDLSWNFLTGVIPHELGNLSKLHYLDLGSNYDYTWKHGWNGSIYGLLGGGNLNWLFNLSSLTYIDLNGIVIDPLSIWASLIERIPSISVMRLMHCNLSAPTTFSNFSSSISTLDLGDNNINSSIFLWLSHLSGSLVELDLSSNVLEGTIPQSFGHMTAMTALTHLNLKKNLLNGPIPQSFGHMTALTHLNLRGNHLTGPIPNSFSHMTALTYLNLSLNRINGEIPNSFGHMTALNHLDLSANQLDGKFPNSICNLSSLKVVDFSSNNLTGSLPDFSLISSLTELRVNDNQLDGYLPTVFRNHLPALQILDLSNNHLRGSLPDFTGFSSLSLLHLSNNAFSGSLPDFTGCSSLRELQLGENRLTEWKTQSTGLLSNLEELDLSKNSIHSTISEAHLSNLSSLVHMDTSFNSLTFELSSEWISPFQLQVLSVPSCKLGPKFPKWIQNQRNIGHLDFSNSQISDTIPFWLWNFDYLYHLNLSSNNLRGNFPGNISYGPDQFDEAGVIDLSSNSLDGPLLRIPAYCREIYLSQNKFSGALLSLGIVEGRGFGGSAFGPVILDISHNQLSGALSDYWMLLPSLGFLNLGYNNFSGRIPPSIGNMVSLKTLILRSNKLYGELPASLRNCRSLGFADFGLNKLSGEVPSWIGEDLPHLYALILKSNRFYGSLPYEICHLSNLHFLDLSMNRISGTIPTCFDNFTAMIRKGKEVVEHIFDSEDPSVQSPSVYTYTYVDNVLARWKGQEYEYGSNFAYLKMIDLSTNNLTGKIPIGITRLLELKGLNLSGNVLYGKVPPEIGQLKVLESLDLSTNKFSGEIPQSMSGLSFLAFLNLSNNNFSGKIPSGTQLQGFDTSTYEGNTGLCGKPLKNICPGDKPADHARPSSSEYEVDEDNSEYMRWLCIGGVLGFSTTFWGIIGTLVLNRRWRHAYYLSLYNLKEWFYVAMAVRIGRLQRNV